VRAARAVLSLALVAGCSRSSAPGAPPSPPTAGDSSSPSPVASAEEPPRSPAPPPPPSPPVDPAPPGEAVRSKLASLEREPLLRPRLAKLKEHFGPSPGGPFELQRAELASGRTALLVSRADESEPIVLVVDRDRLLFAKERPTAGITPPVLHATIAPGPERGVAVFTWVESMHIVAARMWADDANPFAEVEVFHPEACDALSVAYEASVGWILACSSKTGTRVQRLREDLTGAWGREGIVAGTVGPVGRARLGFESPVVWTLDQTAKAVGGDRALSFRYSIDATTL
jgi:hypothetical protein